MPELDRRVMHCRFLYSGGWRRLSRIRRFAARVRASRARSLPRWAARPGGSPGSADRVPDQLQPEPLEQLPQVVLFSTSCRLPIIGLSEARKSALNGVIASQRPAACYTTSRDTTVVADASATRLVGYPSVAVRPTGTILGTCDGRLAQAAFRASHRSKEGIRCRFAWTV